MGCCPCRKQIENDRKNDTQLCLDINNGSSKHLSVMQTINKVHYNDEKDIDISDNQIHPYQLNDLRSLEGVARLWSKQTNTKLSFLQKSSSTPVIGNMYNPNNQLSPLAISTYFFHHTPPNQINLLRSHSDHIASFDQDCKTNKNSKNKSNDLLETLTPQLDMIKEGKYIDRYKTVNNYKHSSANNSPIIQPYGNYGYYNNSAPNSGCNTPQKFSSVSASNLRSPYLTMMNLSPLVSDTDDCNIEMEMEMDNMEMDNMEIEIEMEIENPEENDIFTVISSMESEFNLSNSDFMEHSTSNIGKSNNIGVGASGIVKKGFHFSSCKMLAIKHCRSLKKNKLLAFEKEANLYKKFINNKYIVEIIGIGRGDKNNELIMGLEFMDLNSCQSLQIYSHIKDINIRQLTVGYIGYNVLQGLKYLHSNLYVHNDIKPANILVNKYGEIKLSDFDTVLQLKNKNDMLIKNNGTQKYQSPEKVIFTPCYSTNSDIWSLGITLYELLFGEKKYDNDHDEISYTTNPPILSTTTHNNLSNNCCDFINKCLIINRKNRPEVDELLSHIWLENDIKLTPLKDKWPWLINIVPQQDDINKNEYNENLLFMINSLIVHYSRRKFTAAMSKSASFPKTHLNNINQNNIIRYSDEQRIENMAKYAYCTKDTVLDRIRVTVAYIKSQLSGLDIYSPKGQ